MANIRTIQNKNSKSYKATVRIKGYKPEYKTFSSLTAAKEWAKKVEVLMKEGAYKQNVCFDNNGSKIEYVAQLIDFYKSNVATLRYKTPEKYYCMFEWWKNQIGNVQLKNLSTSTLTQCKNILIDEKITVGKNQLKRKPNTINKYLMCMSAVLTYAVKELELINSNPMTNVKNLKKPNGRIRFLTQEEIKILTQKCKEESDIIYVFFLISLSTGARYSEVLNLKVENFDFDNSQVFYLNTKNTEHRGVHIPFNVLEIIKNYIHKYNINTFLFVNPKTQKFYYIRGILQKIIKNAGIKDFHIHDIRHTTASYIAMNGGSLLDIADILGHKSIVMARRYSHLTQKHTAQIIENVSGKMLENL